MGKQTGIAIIVLTILAGCASNSMSHLPHQKSFSQLGYDALQSAHYAEAEDFLSQSIRAQENPRRDWHNLGVAFERRSKIEPENRQVLVSKAIRCFSMAARYGNPISQQSLVNWNQPVPPADLLKPQENARRTDDDDANTAALLMIFGAGIQGWSAGRESAISGSGNPVLMDGLRQQNTTANCTSNVIGSSVYTNCR